MSKASTFFVGIKIGAKKHVEKNFGNLTLFKDVIAINVPTTK